jgi:hypothetical protein
LVVFAGADRWRRVPMAASASSAEGCDPDSTKWKNFDQVE